jgi:non-lysosomal glucosylceramidase
MSEKNTARGRRAFLQQTVLAAGAAAQTSGGPLAPVSSRREHGSVADATADISYPRVFEGRQLTQIAFPLGGVAAGSISLQ